MTQARRDFYLRNGYLYQRNLHRSDDEQDVVIDLVRRQGTNGLFTIKSNNQRKEILEYEANVSEKVYQASQGLPEELRIIPEFVGKLIHDRVGHESQIYLVFEYIPGESISDVLYYQWNAHTESHRKTLLERLMILLRKVREFERLTGFTHYDLHLGNVLTNDSLETFKLIDFGISHYPGVTGWCQISDTSLIIGAVPSVSDPWFDLTRVISIFYAGIGRKLPREAKRLLEDAKINHDTTSVEIGKTAKAIDELSGLSRIVAQCQTYPGSHRLRSANLVTMVHGSAWDTTSTHPDGRGLGFWVADGLQVDMKRSDLRNFEREEYHQGDPETKIRFGELLACLKRCTNDEKRSQENLDRLLDLIQLDLCPPPADEEAKT